MHRAARAHLRHYSGAGGQRSTPGGASGVAGATGDQRTGVTRVGRAGVCCRA